MNLTEIRERQYILHAELMRLKVLETQMLERIFPPAGTNWTNERYAAHLRQQQALHQDDPALLEMIISELAQIVFKTEDVKRSTRELFTAIQNGDYNHLLGETDE